MAVVRTKKTRGQAAPEPEEELPEARLLSPREWWEMYDARVRKLFGVSSEEFEAARARGEYPEMVDGEEDIRVIDVLFFASPKPE